MYIVGISSYLHDSSAAILKDGVLIAAAEEERFSGVKHSNEFPKNALAYCLKEAGITMDQVKYVGFHWNPFIGMVDRISNLILHLPYSLATFTGKEYGRGDLKTWFSIISLKKRLVKEYGFKNSSQLIYVDHHLAHSSASFLVSPFDDALIFSADAAGESVTTMVSIGRGNKIIPQKSVIYPHSLGCLYLAISTYLGFDLLNGSGKVMGLASYGKPLYKSQFNEILMVCDGSIRLNLKYFNFQYGGNKPFFSKKLTELLGPSLKKGEDFSQRHMDVAASLQNALEEAALSIMRYFLKKTGDKNLCVAGGIGLNGVMNGRLASELPIKNIYVPPAPNDSGSSIGAAYYVFHKRVTKKRSFVLKSPYLGPGFSSDEIEAVLKAKSVKYKRYENINKECARLISEGNMIGWFQGRMEIGPRALGNRSILADPRRAEMKDTLNHKVKFREWFRPFAPAIMEEEVNNYFEKPLNVPFMSIVLEIKKEKRDRIPAVTHVDGTGRLQTVSKEINKEFWGLLDEFNKITGIPIILNTSFNIKGSPIVLSPLDAVICFCESKLDFLVIGNFLVEK